MPELKSPPKADLSADKQRPSSPAWRRWQWLLAPLLGISVILHIGLLFVPLPTLDSAAEETTEDEETPEADDEAPIDILSLSEIAAPEPPPDSPPESAQSPQPQPQPPPTEVPPPPDPQPVEEIPPEADIIEKPPIEEGLAEDPAPAFDAGAATDQFVGDISGLGVENYTAEFGLPEPQFLRNPGHAACFINPANGGPQPGIRVADWLDKEPQTLLQENLQDVYGPRGITFEELPPFCGERYFQAYTAEGQPFMTFSLVTLEGSTLLIVWETPPQ